MELSDVGVSEELGAPLPFEGPHWDEDPLQPIDFGEAALEHLLGDGWGDVELLGYRVTST